MNTLRLFTRQQVAQRLRVLLLWVLLPGTLLMAGCISWPLPEPPAPAARQALLLHNIALVDVEQGVLRAGQDVWIDEGRIRRISATGSQPQPAGSRRIDGSGLYLLPGLWDMHVHSVKWSPQLHHPLYLAHGVTYLRDMSGCMQASDSLTACTSDRQRWQQQMLAGQRSSPFYAGHSSFALNGGREVPAGFPAFLRLQSAQDARALVAHYQALGATMLKTYEGMSPQQLQWLSGALQGTDLQLAGHLPWQVSQTEGLRLGLRSIEHGRHFLFGCSALGQQLKQQPWRSGLVDTARWRAILNSQDPALCQQQMQQLAASQTWWSPTLTTLQMGARAGDAAFRQDRRLAAVPWLLRQLWQSDADAMLARDQQPGGPVQADLLRQAQQQLQQAHRLGVNILAGTDAPDSFVFAGSSLHDELALYTEAGLTPLQALQSATINAARFSGMAEQHGSIAEGKSATLVLLAANPLADISALRQVEGLVLAGHWYDKAALSAQSVYAHDQAGSVRLNLQLLWGALQSPVFRQQFAD